MRKKLNKQEAHLNYLRYKDSYRNYYLKNRKRIIKQKIEYYKKNKKRMLKAQSILRKTRYYKIIERYCNGIVECACCGEKERKFLTLDHINGDGYIHRKEIKGTTTMYRWIVKNNYPPIFQVLCMNCNWGKAQNKVCPHKIKKK